MDWLPEAHQAPLYQSRFFFPHPERHLHLSYHSFIIFPLESFIHKCRVRSHSRISSSLPLMQSEGCYKIAWVNTTGLSFFCLKQTVHRGCKCGFNRTAVDEMWVFMCSSWVWVRLLYSNSWYPPGLSTDESALLLVGNSCKMLHAHIPTPDKS